MEVILTQLMGDRNRKKHMGVFHVYPLSTSWVLIPLFFCPVVKAVAPKPMGFHPSKNPPAFCWNKHVDHLLDKPMGFSVSYPLGWPSTNRGSVADEARSPTLIAHDDPTLGFCCRNRRVPPGVIFPLVEIAYYCRLGCFINRSHNTFR